MDKYSKDSIDWDSYKEHIWVWYMVDKKSLSDILEILKQDDVVATKQQLEFRLKKWRIFKTIKNQEARWMASQLDISRRADEPVIFVKSGKILPENQVAEAVKRHAPLPSFAQKFNTDSDVQLQFRPADLMVCSPGPAGLYAREVEPWGLHSTLPWIRFRYALLDGSFQIQIRGDAQSSMSPDHLLPVTFSSQSSSNSSLGICRFASNLGQIMPEVYTGEHIRRICAIVQTKASLTIDLLEILIFQLSNNFLDWDFNSESIVHLMGVFGLDHPRTIRFLFEAAANQPTILAVLDKFWIAAYETSSTKLASVILTKFVGRYDGSDEFGLQIAPVLRLAIQNENLDLAKVILSGPKSTHVTKALSDEGRDLLEYCTDAWDHEFALAMAALLLERHDSLLNILNNIPTKQHLVRENHHGTRTMLCALNNGNIGLARFLVEAGLNLLHHCDGWTGPSIRYHEGNIIRHWNKSFIDRHTIFTAAVIPHVLLNDTSRIVVDHHRPMNRFRDRAEAEKMVLENYLGLSEMLSEIGKLPEWLEGASSSTQSPDLDVVVLAALYGYDALLQTFTHIPSSLNRVNSQGLWPLSAAALGSNASTCRLLVRLGADPNYTPPLADWPGPLHAAVYHGSTPLVEVLLELGADINHRSWNFSTGHMCFDEHRGPKSALALAIVLCRWETAFLLVHRKAEIDPLAIDLAVQSGNSTLFDLLLNRKLTQCINGKNEDSASQIVPRTSDATSCDELFGPQARQMTYNILSKAASSGSLSIVSRLLKMEISRSDHHSLQNALSCSLEQGFEDVSLELIRAGAKLSDFDLVACFRSCTLTGIHELTASSHDSLFSSVERGLQDFILEFAILDNTLDVVKFALETFPKAYSSGALSAAVLRAAGLDFHDSEEPMNELLLRRSNTDSEQLDPILENTALAIAILFQAPAEVIESLLQRPWPEMPAIIQRDKRGMLLVDITQYHEILAEIFLAQQNSQNLSYAKDFRYHDEELMWYSDSHHGGVIHILPLTLAIEFGNDQVYAKLMAKGFLADRRTIEAAIEQHTSPNVWEGVLMSCKEGHDIIRLWDGILHFALDCKNAHVMRHLIHNGANMGRKDDIDFEPRRLGITLLQRAVSHCLSTGDRLLVQLLLDAGADVNEAPAKFGGATALQAAAQNGQLDLARKLVSLGADINARRALWDGFTCLEAAARAGRLDMTQFLLDAGATITGKGRLQYIRAVKLAERYGHAAVAQILRKHRPWDELDKSLFRQDEVHDLETIILHPVEYTLEEICNLTKEILLQRSTPPEYEWKIWPEIDPSEIDGTGFIHDGADTHHSAAVNDATPMHEGLVVASTSQLTMNVLDNGSPGSYTSPAEQSNSQMVFSNCTPDYSMPLHTSFIRFQDDPDFHERNIKLEDI